MGLLGANIFARADHSVVVVEAGGRVADTSGNFATRESFGKRNSGVSISQASGFGGASVLWGGQLAEFEAIELTRRRDEWPLQYQELQPWLDHIYALFALRGRRSTNDYCGVLGGETGKYFGIERFCTFCLPQPNFATLYRHVILSIQ